MIRPRRVVTRRQYDKWNRHRQLVESLCSGWGTTGTRPSSSTSQQHYRRVEIPMPLSPLPSDDTNNVDYERLEIYDGVDTPHPTHLKRRRTPSRVAFYRQIDVEIDEDEVSSKGSSTYTGSIGRSHSFTAEMANSHEDTATLLSDQHSESFISEPQHPFVAKRKVERKGNPKMNQPKSTRYTYDATDGRGVPTSGNNISSPFNAFSPTSVDISIPDVSERRMDMSVLTPRKYSVGTAAEKGTGEIQLLCCDHLATCFKPKKEKEKKKKVIERPGMSLSEERRLWRSFLEGDLWANHHQYIRATTDMEDVTVDEIEIVPMDNDFQATGTDNYAETDNVGMLFVTTLQTDPNNPQQATSTTTGSPNSDATKLPWWKRDQWKLSPKITSGAGSESQTGIISRRTKMSTQTKKISNCTDDRQQQRDYRCRHDNEHTAHREPISIHSSAQSPYRQDIEPIRDPKTVYSSQNPNGEGSTTLTPRLSPIRQFNDSRRSDTPDDRTIMTRDDDGNDFEEEMMQYHQPSHNSDALPTRPFQVYTAKLERRKDIHQNTDTLEMDSDVALMFPIPHFNNNNREQLLPPFVRPRPTSTIVETVHTADSESILSDLSEMIRQVDQRQEQNDIIHCEDISHHLPSPQQQQQQRETTHRNSYNKSPTTTTRGEVVVDEFDNRSSLQNSIEENIAPESIVREATTSVHHSNRNHHHYNNTKNIPHVDRLWNTRQSLSPVKIKPPITASLSNNNDRNTMNLKNRTQVKQETADGIKFGCSNETINSITERTVQSPMPIPVEYNRNSRQCHRSERGRKHDDLIDLTNLQEPSATNPQQRKRSKSPIRLYGDPPVHRHMDGSPVRYRAKSNSKSSLQYDEPKKITEKTDTSREALDIDLSTLQDILARRNDIADLLAVNSPKSNHVLRDGSKVVMLKPVVNVYKIRSENDISPTLPQRYKKKCSSDVNTAKQDTGNNFADLLSDKKTKSPKVSLQIRTVFSDGESDLAAHFGFNPAEYISSPIVTISIDDDDSSIDDELRQLAESEKILRKELEEVQKRSAVRRWQIDETVIEVKSRETKRRVVEEPKDMLPYGNENFESPSCGDLPTTSFIDLSFMDMDIEEKNEVICPPLDPTLYDKDDTSKTDLYTDPRVKHPASRNANLCGKTKPSQVKVGNDLKTQRTLISPLPIETERELTSPPLDATTYDSIDTKKSYLYADTRYIYSDTRPSSSANSYKKTMPSKMGVKIEPKSERTLVSPLPVASAYKNMDPQKNIFNQNSGMQFSPIHEGSPRKKTIPSETEVELVDDKRLPISPFRLLEHSGSLSFEVDCASPFNLPMTLSGLSKRLRNVYYGSNHPTMNDNDATPSPECSKTNQSNGLYVPSLSTYSDNHQPGENKYFGSNYSPIGQTQSGVNRMDYHGTKYESGADVYIDREPSFSNHNENFQSGESRYLGSTYSPTAPTRDRISGVDCHGIRYEADDDVFIDREPSWGTIEKLYQLSMHSASYVTFGLSGSFEQIPAERNVEHIRRNLSPPVRAQNSSSEFSGVISVVDPLFNFIERRESATTRSNSTGSSDIGNLTDIDTLEVDMSVGNTVTDQSIYGALLQYSPRNESDKKKVIAGNNRSKDLLSPRLKSLLDQHASDMGLNEGTAEYHTIKNNHVDNNDSKAQGIYAELVRRSRRAIKTPQTNKCSSSEPLSCDDSNAAIPKSPISSVVKRFARQSSPVKRLERLRKLHNEMQVEKKAEEEAKIEVEKESHFSRRLSPARKRATKSLNRRIVSSQPKCDTPLFTLNDTKANSYPNGVVQVFMSVTRSTDSEVRKLKRDAETPSRDLISLASSTRSHSLVNSLPSSAKARSAASGKPGSLLWIATAGRDKK